MSTICSNEPTTVSMQYNKNTGEHSGQGYVKGGIIYFDQTDMINIQAITYSNLSSVSKIFVSFVL